MVGGKCPDVPLGLPRRCGNRQPTWILWVPLSAFFPPGSYYLRNSSSGTLQRPSLYSGLGAGIRIIQENWQTQHGSDEFISRREHISPAHPWDAHLGVTALWHQGLASTDLCCQGRCYLWSFYSICFSMISCSESFQALAVTATPFPHPSIVCKATKASRDMRARLSYLNRALADKGQEQRNW